MDPHQPTYPEAEAAPQREDQTCARWLSPQPHVPLSTRHTSQAYIPLTSWIPVAGLSRVTASFEVHGRGQREPT